MLVEVRIHNFAIIEELSLELCSGLNVLSGETGSGKSLLLDAFQLILGGRPKSSYFRKGTDGWEIEALLSLEDTPEEIRLLLPEQVREETEILLSRTMSLNGRGKVYMNGKLATVAMLQEISTRLLALCTQGQQMHLHDPEYLLTLVDDYVGASALVEQYKKQFAAFRELQREHATLLTEKERRVLRRAELEFILQELSAIAPEAGMRDALEEDLQKIKKSQDMASVVQGSLEILLDHAGIFSLLDRLQKEIASITEDEGVAVRQQAERVVEEVTQLEQQLRRFEGDEQQSDVRLEEVSHQLSELARLERKYRTDDEGLGMLYQKALEERGEGDDGEREQLLNIAIAEKQEAVEKLAAEIRSLRYGGRAEFEDQMQKELSDLGMKTARIILDFEECELSEQGTEKVRFLFAPNPGEEPKPLSDIASGGELSRVMLVMKKLFRDRSGVNILVFDEVDTGVSGAIAQAVGEKMSEISKFSQVICITHLPQVACYADTHFSISKESGKRTRSIISQLDGNSRVEELAKMLSGYKVTDAARASARELIASKSAA